MKMPQRRLEKAVADLSRSLERVAPEIPWEEWTEARKDLELARYLAYRADARSPFPKPEGLPDQLQRAIDRHHRLTSYAYRSVTEIFEGLEPEKRAALLDYAVSNQPAP